MVDIARALNREAICKYSFSKGSNLGEFSRAFHNNVKIYESFALFSFSRKLVIFLMEFGERGE